jgi:hypothetical protein
MSLPACSSPSRQVGWRMPKAILRPEEEPTDPHEYLRRNPQFAKCRRRHHWEFPRGDSWVESYNEDDPVCNFEIVSVCPKVDRDGNKTGCGQVRRERAHLTIVRDKVTERVILRTWRSKVDDYATRGIGHFPRDILQDFEFEELGRKLRAAKRKPR